MGTTNYANGTWLRTSTMYDLFSGGAALCSDGKVRVLARIAITADTFFSIPAAVKVRGKTVSGYVSVDTLNDDQSTVKFHAYAYGRNAGLLPASDHHS